MSSNASAARLLPIHREREQHVARQALPHAVAGVGEDHSVGDGGSGRIERAALSGDSVSGLVILHGVEVPNDLAGLGGISAEMAVDRAGENHAGHGGDGGGLSAGATLPSESETASAAGLWRTGHGWSGSAPDFFASGEIHRMDSAGLGAD